MAHAASRANKGGRRPGWRAAPLVRVLVAQALGGALAFGGALGLAASFGREPPLFAVLVGQGVLAAFLGDKVLRLPRWWIPVQMAMPPAAALASFIAVPSWVYLIAFALLALVYWNAARSRVPLYLTNRRTHAALARLLPRRSGSRFLDLGHGFGGTVMALARDRPDMLFEGVETAPLPHLAARLRHLLAGPANAHLAYGDLWKRDLAGYDVVYAFLSPAPMTALYAKARAEMTPGSLLVSNSFAVPDCNADDVRTVDDTRATQLHLYRM